jgi:hypothetical protein
MNASRRTSPLFIPNNTAQVDDSALTAADRPTEEVLKDLLSKPPDVASGAPIKAASRESLVAFPDMQIQEGRSASSNAMSGLGTAEYHSPFPGEHIPPPSGERTS